MTARMPIPSAVALQQRSTKPLDRHPLRKAIKARTTQPRTATLRATSVDDTTGALAHLKSPTRPLTEKQKLFIKHWAAGDSILSAAYRAGYADSGTLAYRMVKDPAILVRYQEEKRKYEAACGMTREKVMDGLAEAIDMARILADPMAMIAGWREVGKMCGYYAPVAQKIDINITGNNAFARLNRMSDAELLKLVEAERITLDGDFKEVPQLSIIPDEENDEEADQARPDEPEEEPDGSDADDAQEEAV